MAGSPVRAISYLSPGIPLGFFQHVAEFLGRALERDVVVESDPRTSGPMHGQHDPFASGRADLGFLCSPSYLYLRSLPRPSVELVPAGFVFRDPRNGAKPLYFSDVIVRADCQASTLEDLRGRSFGYNDRCSLSGYYAMHQALARRSLGAGFFGGEVCTGSHAESIRAVASGSIDAAAIDSNVLLLAMRENFELTRQLEVLESFGPHPIQPVVVSMRLGPEVRARIASALLALAGDAEAMGPLAWIGLERCVRIDDGLYEEERIALQELGHLPVPRQTLANRG